MTKAHQETPPGETEAQEIKRLMRTFRSADAAPSPAEWIPAWSSYSLEKAVAQVLRSPESSAGGLVRGFWELLGETNAPLTQTMTHFIHAVVVLCFSRYRAQYREADFVWMVQELSEPCTEAQAFLAAYALPEPLMKSRRAEILAALRNSPFYLDTETMLSD